MHRKHITRIAYEKRGLGKKKSKRKYSKQSLTKISDHGARFVINLTFYSSGLKQGKRLTINHLSMHIWILLLCSHPFRQTRLSEVVFCVTNYDGESCVSAWVGHEVSKHMAKHYSASVWKRTSFWVRSTLEKVDWVRQVASSSMCGPFKSAEALARTKGEKGWILCLPSCLLVCP